MRLRSAHNTFVVLVASIAAPLHAQAPAPTRCLESEARPPVTPADLEIVNRAMRMVSSAASWNRAARRDCPATAATFSLQCALEKASDEVTGKHQHRQAALQEARFVIDDIAPRAKDYDHRLLDYNNDPATTFADIGRFFRLLQSRIAERLKENPAQAHAEATSLAAYCASIDRQIAKRVLEILDSPSKWDRASTQNCGAHAVTFGIYCAFEKATREVIGDFDCGGAAMNAARKLIGETAPNRDKYQARLVDYNNDPTVVFEDVRNLLRTVEEQMTERESEATRALPR
jgi:hypothetical protein